MRITSNFIFLFLFLNGTFAQLDTINHTPHNYSKNETVVKTTILKDGQVLKSKTKKSKATYTLDEKKSNGKDYELAAKESKRINDCKPCWLRYFDKDGKLFQEGLSYKDCALGRRTEYYQSGKVKVVRHYKTNETNDWIAFPCSVADGTWTYYKEDGTIEKFEQYKDGIEIK